MDDDRMMCFRCCRPMQGGACPACDRGQQVSLSTLRAMLGSAGPVYIKTAGGGVVRALDCFCLSSTSTPEDDDPFKVVIEAGPGSGWSTGLHEWIYQRQALVTLADGPTFTFTTPQEVEEFLAS